MANKLLKDNLMPLAFDCCGNTRWVGHCRALGEFGISFYGESGNKYHTSRDGNILHDSAFRTYESAIKAIESYRLSIISACFDI